MNFAKLNHVLIPPTKAGRDRLRRGRFGWVLLLAEWAFAALSTEGRVLLVLLGLLGTMGLEVYGTRVFWLWSAVTGLLAASLLVRRAFVIRQVRIEITAPQRVTVGATMRFEIALHNASERDYSAVRLAGPFLPWDGRWLHPPPVFPELRARHQVSGELHARFIERGDHHLDSFTAALLVPFGLAMGPALRSSGTRFKVVPRIAPVEHVSLPLAERYHPGGIAQASRTGEAMELVGVRPYRRGDPVRDLHALTWARTGLPHVREYRQEYYSRVGVVIDNDRVLASEVGLEAMISLGAGVVACLSRGEALIDLLVVDGQVHPLTLGRSLGFLEQALDLLATVHRGGSLVSDELVEQLAPYLGRLSCVVLITEAARDERRPNRSQAAQDRLELVAALELRGVPTRLLRVTRSAKPIQQTPTEHAVPVDAINAEEPLWL